jgi:hypothetical protein
VSHIKRSPDTSSAKDAKAAKAAKCSVRTSCTGSRRPRRAARAADTAGTAALPLTLPPGCASTPVSWREDLVRRAAAGTARRSTGAAADLTREPSRRPSSG